MTPDVNPSRSWPRASSAPRRKTATPDDLRAAAADLDALIRETTAGAQARADTLAQLPRLGWAVATDESTMHDLTTEELAFRPHPGEQIEITQMRRGGGEPRRLLELPADSQTTLPVLPGTHTIVQGDHVSVVTVVSVVLHGAEAPGLPEKRLRVWQVYWVADRLTPSAAWAKVLAVEDRLLGRGDDAAAIVLYAVEDRPGEGRQALEAFARANLPAIVAQLRANREGAHVRMVTNTVPLSSRTVPE